MPRVLNKKTSGVPASAVYVGRPTAYGNPYFMRDESQRDAVCDAYDAWIAKAEQQMLRAQIRHELKGRDLVCWCAPKRCHADTLIRIANED